jgi:hypothetical protein
VIWFKAWCEVKPRLQLALFMVVLTGLANVLAMHYSGVGIARSGAFDSILGASLPPVAASPDPQALIAWRAYLQLTVMLLPFLGIMMAGSGIYSRLAYALKEETHPSMIYTLALPVPRRRWLDVRAGMGLALTAALTLLALAIPPIVTGFLHQPFSWEWPLQTAPFLLLGTTVFYMLAVMLEVLGNENWRLGSVAAFLFLVAAQLAFGSRFRVFPFLVGYDASIAGLALCVVLSVVFYAGALAAFERREF